MRVVTDYKTQLISLLPVGKLWPSKNLKNNITEILTVFSAELLQVENRHNDLVNELHPISTNELINRWEYIVGLPDDCIAAGNALQQRINAVLSKLFTLGKGNLNEQFYINQAAALGYTITITVLSANSWQVNAPILTTTYFKAGLSKCGEKIQTSGNDLLECVINKTKPAHTVVTYSYT